MLKDSVDSSLPVTIGHRPRAASQSEGRGWDLEMGDISDVSSVNDVSPPKVTDSDAIYLGDTKLALTTTRIRNATLESNFTGTTQCSASIEPPLPSPISSSSFPSKSSNNDHFSTFERRAYYRIADPVSRFFQRKTIVKIRSYLRGGPSIASRTELIRPWFPRIESFFDKLFAPIYGRSVVLLPLFLVGWFLAFLFFVRLSYFTSSTSAGEARFITGTDSYWYKNGGCGLNGSLCLPFGNATRTIRCPGQTLMVQLLNYLDVGTNGVIFQPLVVGGFDELATYRADSWICAAAQQQGLFGDKRGGCATIEKTGAFTNFIGGRRNGVSSVGFPTVFPSTYRFDSSVSQVGCSDLQDDILVMNVILSFVFSLVFRPRPLVFFWVLFCLGFWHIALVSDEAAFPPNVGVAIKSFLPCLFVGYVIWKISFRYVVAGFEHASLERSVLYLAGFWVGALFNLSTGWIPITRLTPRDIAQRPGGLIAVIVLAIVLLLLVMSQLRVIRRSGSLPLYGKIYGIGLLFVPFLCAIPGYQSRFHHYIAAIVFLPGTAYRTRPSAIFQGFCLGMFLNGVARWGFDAILETAAQLIGDGATGSFLPDFVTNSTSFVAGQTSISWSPIPDSLEATYSQFSLLIDDVLRYTGPATNISIANLTSTLPHYFRLAYSGTAGSGDFTKAATAFIANGTWVDALPGAGG